MESEKPKWRIKATAVYYTIVDENDNLICFMSLTPKDLENANIILTAVNGTDL